MTKLKYNIMLCAEDFIAIFIALLFFFINVFNFFPNIYSSGILS